QGRRATMVLLKPVAVLARNPKPLLYALLVVFVAAGIPGSSVRGVVHDLAAPAVPATVGDRDASLDVFVHDEQGGLLEGAVERSPSWASARIWRAPERRPPTATRRSPGSPAATPGCSPMRPATVAPRPTSS